MNAVNRYHYFHDGGDVLGLIQVVIEDGAEEGTITFILNDGVSVRNLLQRTAPLAALRQDVRAAIDHHGYDKATDAMLDKWDSAHRATF